MPILEQVPTSAPAGKTHYERVPAVTFEGSLYTPAAEPEQVIEADIFRNVEFNTEDNSYSPLEEQNRYPHAEFRSLMNTLFHKHKPTKHRFWSNLKTAPSSVVRGERFISELYKRYQAAMHATRAAVWFTPHLDTPRLRQRKAAIIVDDDTVDGDSTHHQLCESLFRFLGASQPEPAENFGSLDQLRAILDDDTYAFCETAWTLYAAGTGAWAIFEVLSDNWQSGLADSLAAHFEKEELLKQRYFEEIQTGHIEILHMLETVSLTEAVLHRKPELAQQAMAHAVEMAEATDRLWDGLDAMLTQHINEAASLPGQ